MSAAYYLIYFVCVWVLSVGPLLEPNHEILMRNLYHLLVCESCLESFSHWQMFASSNGPFDLIFAENSCDFRTGNKEQNVFSTNFWRSALSVCPGLPYHSVSSVYLCPFVASRESIQVHCQGRRCHTLFYFDLLCSYACAARSQCQNLADPCGESGWRGVCVGVGGQSRQHECFCVE